jgi:hypothetical protein|tara:strand:+ start:209 stop:526 length:318 start_codon:yes stop_codon:yes gene_type:complete
MGDGGRRRAERRAREKAEREAREYERELKRKEEENAKRLAEIEKQNKAKEERVQYTMAQNAARMAEDPVVIRRKRKRKRGAGSRGLDRLRIAREVPQQGTSTNLG